MRKQVHGGLRCRLFGCSTSIHTFTQQGLHNAMNDQVRIAADWRGEVRVRRCGEREVALVVCRVFRLLERAEQQIAKDALLRLACDLRGEALIQLGRNVSGATCDLVPTCGAMRGTSPVAITVVAAKRLALVTLGRKLLNGDWART